MQYFFRVRKIERCRGASDPLINRKILKNMCIFFLDHFPLYRYCSFCINQHAIPDFFSFFSWRKILNALQDILEKALENFIVMFFEIEVSNPISLISFIYHVLCVSLSLSISRQKSRNTYVSKNSQLGVFVSKIKRFNDTIKCLCSVCLQSFIIDS